MQPGASDKHRVVHVDLEPMRGRDLLVCSVQVVLPLGPTEGVQRPARMERAVRSVLPIFHSEDCMASLKLGYSEVEKGVR